MIQYFPLSENNNYSLKDVTQFNNVCFKIRGDHFLYDNYRFVGNPFADKNRDFIYCVTKNEKYVAQMLTMPMPLSLNEEMINAYWGQDYFVSEEYRGQGIGKKLSNLYLKKNFYIAVGFSGKSAVIHQKMGAKKIGYLDFYFKWAPFFQQVKFYVHRALKIKPKNIISYHFPHEVNDFIKITDVSEIQLQTLNWNANMIETLRNRDYFAWRFFFKKNIYSFYQLQQKTTENPLYFVAKPYFYKGVNWLRIVDYRFKIANPEDFSKIVHTAELLRKQMNLYGILISSSLKISADILQKNAFKRSKHEVVLTTYPFIHDEKVTFHNHFMITFADSDMDMHTNLGKFVYG